MFFCKAISRCSRKCESSRVHDKIKFCQFHGLNCRHELFSAEDTETKGGLKAKQRNKSQKEPCIKLLVIDAIMVEFFEGSCKEGEE